MNPTTSATESASVSLSTSESAKHQAKQQAPVQATKQGIKDGSSNPYRLQIKRNMAIIWQFLSPVAQPYQVKEIKYGYTLNEMIPVTNPYRLKDKGTNMDVH